MPEVRGPGRESVPDDGREGRDEISHATFRVGRRAKRRTSHRALPPTTCTDATHYIATQHLEGDFPGGAVDLRYRFTLRDDRIERLVIAP
ncbi:hypothetical protein [Streptomyces sp. NPDC088554]|uniref:hypothetical protein n=1 Tax=Streptomyces sp. NPDC088554 TaxID=3365865 RepID=UPI0037FCFD74